METLLTLDTLGEVITVRKMNVPHLNYGPALVAG